MEGEGRATAAPPTGRAVPWVEKYRPKTVTDVSHQSEVVETLKRAVTTQNLPHLIFYGPPGTGKTSTILACARDLFGSELKKRVLELNASDERGISIVRTKIKSFAMVSVHSRANEEGQSMPPYKLIVLDEADSMTSDAQSALRRTMETYCRITRFCIICNYVSRLIPPITSRCAKFHFKPLPPTATLGRLRSIAQQESVNVTDEVLTQITEQAEGDMRKAIQTMQSLHRLSTSADGAISEQAVLDIAGALPASTIRELLAVCEKGPRGFQAVQAELDRVLREGYPAGQLLVQLSAEVVTSASLSEQAKCKVSLAIAEADKQLTDGANEYLQLLDVFGSICRFSASPPGPSA